MIHKDEHISTLTTKQILKDNSHFIGEITLIKIESAQAEDFASFGYTLYCELGCTGNQYHAGYNYHPIRKQWELGCN